MKFLFILLISMSFSQNKIVDAKLKTGQTLVTDSKKSEQTETAVNTTALAEKSTLIDSPILSLINQTPSPILNFFFALLGTLLTLSGVLIGHLLTFRQFYKRIAHEAKLKTQESHSSFQKEIYLEAAESVAQTLAVLGKLPFKQLNEIEQEVSKLNLSAVSNKVSMIGSNKTINALGDFIENYTKALFDIYTEALPQQMIRNRLNNLDVKIKENLDLMKRINAQISAIPFEHRTDTFMLDRNQHFEQVKNEFDLMMDESNELNEKLYNISAERLMSNMAAMEDMSKNLVEANIAIREELKLPFNESDYRERTELAFLRNKKRLNEFIEKIRKN